MTTSGLDASVILAAGGVLPLDREVPKGGSVDVVVARSYAHRAVPGRVVVRMVPSNLARGIDLEMQTLGFDAAGTAAEVGRERRRALGFPGWALVHDSKNARYALDVVRDLRKAVRRAKSKPGHAKEAIDAIAETLGKSVPGFLPSFFEEAGRAFLEADAHSYAAQYFEKAREAERVHALAIDEDVRRDAFLEFALAGAVSIKSLSSYAKDLEKSRSPAEAYAQFRRLSVQRTLGGLPPWGGMAKELARLAKLAGLDPDEEARAIIREILGSPSLKRAASDFWIAYREPVVELARTSPAIRGALLALFPEAGDGFTDTWLALLADAGALDAVFDASEPEEAQPAAGPAAWIGAMHVHSRRGWRDKTLSSRLFDVVTRAAPRLRAEGKPIAFLGRYQRQVDLDLTEHALALDVVVADPADQARADFASWTSGSAERGRDPVRLAAHPTLGRLVQDGLDQVVGTQPFEAVARGKKGLYAARRAWLVGAIEGARGGLPALSHALDRIASKTGPALFAEIEGAYAALAALDPAAALLATLRGGIGGELGWPAFDEAMRELDPEGKGGVIAHGIFPRVCLATSTRVIAVGPTGRLATHDPTLPKNTHLAGYRSVGSSVLVMYRDASWKFYGYWSHAPSDVFELGRVHAQIGLAPGVALERPNDGVLEGERTMRAGDRTMTAQRLHASDGETVWRQEWTAGHYELREVDPETGALGRRSMPAFYESWRRDGMSLNVASSWLYPLPAGTERTPLGQKDGLAGLRTRMRDPKSAHAASVPLVEREWIDGCTWRQDARTGLQPIAFVAWPGTDRPRVLGGDASRAPAPQSAQGYGQTFLLWEEDGTVPHWNVHCGPPGSATGMLTVPFWHYLVPRDEAGSRALRGLDLAAARVLLDARAIERPKGSAFDAAPMHEVLRRVLPEVTHPLLQRELLFAVDVAAASAARLAELVRARDPLATDVGPPARPPIGSLAGPLASLLSGTSARGNGDAIADVLATFSRFARRTTRDDGDRIDAKQMAGAWHELAGHAGALAYVAASPATTAADRTGLLALLEVWADSVLAEPDRTFALITAHTHAIDRGCVVTRSGSDWYAELQPAYSPDNQRTFLVHTPPGATFTLPSSMTVKHTRSAGDAWATPERIRAFVADVRANGPWAWSEAAVSAFVQRTGVTRAEAALLLAGLPECQDYGPPLSAPRRALLGVKLPQAKEAIASFRAVPRLARMILLSTAMPPDASVRDPLGAGPTDEESLVARLARAWVASQGRRASVPDALVALAAKEIKHGGARAQDALAAFASPDTAGELVHDAAPGAPDPNAKVARGAKPRAFAPSTATTVALYAPWLELQLPVGDPIRANIPRAIELVRARLANPKLEVALANRWGRPEDKDWPASALDVVTGRVDDHRRDDGLLVAQVQGRSVHYAFRPSQVKSEADWARIDAIAKLSTSALLDASIRRVLGPDYDALAARTASTPVPVGKYEACPLWSVPSLVGAASKKLRVSEDAAVLYLQTLALVAPTKKAVETWNDWKSARYAAAAVELTKAELLLEAKRERAGRAHFLPGGWEALDAPFMPIETWKLPLYELREVGTQIVGPLRLHLPLGPVHAVFEKAWARIEEGDAPRYADVKAKPAKAARAAKAAKGKKA